ncbi:flavin reductase like domain-containing protein [Massariosphaeria phaeospora]|uniref:Flavin reductase like domain-containing protein n=1 Tax=Massariosphaeria phaeospora TaxID=100035 RepID=A0A7C8ICX5_9PLEO|nr:flavin reductase like domain-containing protein [Massariosphaeria phaeospora]
MAAQQRLISRFFVAFYQWNRYTQRPACNTARLCLNPSRRQPTLRNFRTYIATHPHRQNEQVAAQSDTEESSSTSPQSALKEASHEQDGEQSITRSTRDSDINQEHIKVEQTRLRFRNNIVRSHSEVVLDQRLRHAVRELMRHVPSSVAIITAASIDPTYHQPVPLGIAVSSLSTVTLDPPTISFNVKHPSQTLDAIRAANGRFRVHFLSAHKNSAAAADLFTKGNHALAYSERRKNLQIELPEASGHLGSASSAAPQIRDDTVVAALECELTQEMTVSDHIIAVAKISSIESQHTLQSTLVYVQGKYVSVAAEELRDHQVSSRQRGGAASVFLAVDTLRDLPLLPGQHDRQTLKNDIDNYIKNNPWILSLPMTGAYKQLSHALRLPYASLGISTITLLTQHAKNAGHKLHSEVWDLNLPIMYDYYGRISPSDVASAVQRAKNLVTRNAHALSTHYKRFLPFLGVQPNNHNLLASDILNPLRAEGLAPPFKPWESAPPSRNGKIAIVDLECLEQIEHRLLNYLQSKSENYDATLRMSDGLLAEKIHFGGNIKFTTLYVGRIRGRLHVEASPLLFNPAKAIVSGHITKEEARVVLNRVIGVILRSGTPIDKQLLVPPWEILRQAGVHPLITGIDIEFLLEKLRYLRRTVPRFRNRRAFQTEVISMLKPWLANRLEFTELESRLKAFVDMAPMKAMTWSYRDSLAAAGVGHNCMVQVPTADKEIKNIGLHATAVRTLLAKLLKDRHGRGTEEENEAIAGYLQTEYNYDVTTKEELPMDAQTFGDVGSGGDSASTGDDEWLDLDTEHTTLSDGDAGLAQYGNSYEELQAVMAEHMESPLEKKGFRGYGLDGARK